ncbi:MAG: hypothetical protein ACRD2A_17865, partial [Vicinamibacterales bacterium]
SQANLELLGHERQAQLLGIDTASDAQFESLSKAWLTIFPAASARLEADAKARLKSAATPQELRRYVDQLLGGAQQRARLGSTTSTETELDELGPIIADRCREITINELKKVVAARGADEVRYQLRYQLPTIDEVCSQVSQPDYLSTASLPPNPEAKANVDLFHDGALAAIASASRYEAVRDAMFLRRLFATSVPSLLGYTTQEMSQRRSALDTALTPKIPGFENDLLNRIKSGLPSQAKRLADSYMYLVRSFNRSDAGLQQLADGWLKEAVAIVSGSVSCAGADSLSQRLQATWEYVPEQKRSGFWSLGRGRFVSSAWRMVEVSCLDYVVPTDPKAIAQFVSGLADRGSQFDALITALVDRKKKGEAEEVLKEELAWALAAVIRDTTQYFAKGDGDEAKALWNAHRASDYVIRYRSSKSREEKVAAA